MEHRRMEETDIRLLDLFLNLPASFLEFIIRAAP